MVLVALTVEAVRRAVPGIPVGVTTREGLVSDGVERLAVVSRWPRPDDGGPDFASVNWHEGMTHRPRHRAADASHRDRGRPLDSERRGRLRRAALAVAGDARPHRGRPRPSPGGYGTWAAERILSALGSQPAPLLVHGEDQWAWPVLRWAQQQGYDTRIGLEDTLFDEAGLRARSNAALVREAITGRREP